MKFTLSWLKDYLKTDKSLEQIVGMLTAIGLEVENVDNRSVFDSFVIARVLTSEKHPDADKLQVLGVDTGDGKLIQVVCGATNAYTGLTGVFAHPGTYIPGIDKTVSIKTVRGVSSFGMMCSERELLLSNNCNNIIDLPPNAPVGASFSVYAGLNDPIINVNITPNRADCTSVRGIARDLIAAGIGTLNKSVVTQAIVSESEQNSLKVYLTSYDTKSPCFGYSWRMIKNVKNRMSPVWMRRRLTAVGQHSINAFVDIINYLALDQGYPLHIFDADKIEGNLTIRQAYEGEKIYALNKKEYILSSRDCVVADKNNLVSISGIIGGKSTICDSNTKNIIIEAALWNPLDIARTGRELDIRSDARYRFERGVDHSSMIHVLELSTKMICDICGGRPTKVEVSGFVMPVKRKILFPFDEVKRLTGCEVPIDKARSILTLLGFEIEGTDRITTVKVPTWRPDINGKADLVEEIIRIYGVDQIKPQPLIINYTIRRKSLSLLQIHSRNARRVLANRGMMEIVTWTFISEKMARIFGGGCYQLKLINPIAANMSNMRPSLLPGLIAAAKRNIARGFVDLALFEVSDIYKGNAPKEQYHVAGGIRCGTAKITGSGRDWANNADSVNVFDSKADALAVLVACNIPIEKTQVEVGAPSWYHPGRSGIIKFSPGIVLGYFGEFHPDVLEHLEIGGPLCGFEVFINTVPIIREKTTKIRPLSDFSPLQRVRRDFAFIVDKTVTAACIMQAALNADEKLIHSVQILDHFEGETIGVRKKSVAIEVTIQPLERSMTDEAFKKLSKKIVANVIEATNGVLRCINV